MGKNLKRKRILVVGAGEWQIPMIKKAKELGLEVVATDRNPHAPGLNIADIGEMIDTIDIKKNLNLAKRLKIHGVVTMATDYAVPTVAYIAEALSLVGMSYNTAVICSNKISTRRELIQSKIPAPKHLFLNLRSDNLNDVKLKFPVVIKPSDSCGSKGVKWVNDRDEFKKAVSNIGHYTKKEEIIVEEYLVGSEVSVEGLVYQNNIDIVAITDKKVSSLPFFVEIGHTIPTVHGKKIQDQIKSMVRDVVNGLKIDNSAFHIESKITPHGPKLIEVGARLGGGTIASHLVPLAVGVDLVGEVIKMAIGGHPKTRSVFNKAACVRFFMPKPGRVASIPEYSNFLKNKDVVDIVLHLRKGDVIKKMESSNDRVGYIITKGKIKKDTIKLAESLRERIDNNIEIM